MKTPTNTLWIALLLLITAYPIHAAWQDNLPSQYTQPDGKQIDAFRSGDEHHNWFHDAQHYTMIIDAKTGYLCWAIAQDGDLTSTGKPVHLYTPQALHLQPNESISEQVYHQKRRLLADHLQRNPNRAPTTGTINQIVVFIRFSDEDEFNRTVSEYNLVFNDTSTSNEVSMKRYFWEASYNQLTLNSHFLPTPSGPNIISYQDTQPRGYYMPYNEITNPIGYDQMTGERLWREAELLQRATEAIASQIPQGLTIDGDDDGNVDNVNYVVKGSSTTWGELLWPHTSTLSFATIMIGEKRVWDFNVNLETSMQNTGASTLCHEFGHTLGAPDYYSSTNGTTIGMWDLMATNGNPPQSMSAYTKWYYMHWIPEPPLITTSGTYTLNAIISNQTDNAYRIPSPNSSTEYFLVEFRKRATTNNAIDLSIIGSGMLIYRVNTMVAGHGNSSGPPNELYVFRAGGSPTSNGTFQEALFSASDPAAQGRTAINDTTDPFSFLSNGLLGGLDISDISASSGTSMTFYVNMSNGNYPPYNLSAVLDDNDIELNWSAPVLGTPDGYNVYRNQSDTPINQSPITDLTYTDLDLPYGYYYAYTVTAVYGSDESVETAEVVVAVIPPAVSEFYATFEDGPSEGWMLINGTQTNKWIVGDDTAAGDSDFSIYISDDGNTNAYTNNSYTAVHFFRDIVYTSETRNRVSFDFKGAGETIYDFVVVYLMETDTIPVAGSFPEVTILGQFNQEDDWTQKIVSLPDHPIGSVKRLVFTWRNDYNGGDQPPAALDNIAFYVEDPLPVFTISPATHDFGGLTIGATSPAQTFTISNTGNATLTVTDVTLEGADDFPLTVAGIPWEIEAGDDNTFTVAFSPLSAGDKEATLTITHNAEGSPVSVAVSGQGVQGGPVIPYSEDFESGTSLFGIGWGSFISQYSGILAFSGVDSSNGLALDVYASIPTQNAYTPTIYGIETETRLSFEYRIVNYPQGQDFTGNVTEKVLGENDKVYIEVSTTGGAGEYTVLKEINHTNHMPSTSFVTFNESLAEYATQNVNIRFRNVYGNGDWYAIFDNVVVGNIEPPEPPQPPGQVTLVSPANNAVDVAISPTFTWGQPEGDVSGYYVYLGTSTAPYDAAQPAENRIAELVGDSEISYTLTTQQELQYESVYYWQVVAFNDVGRGNASVTFSFTTIDDPESIEDETLIPHTTALRNNYPNPFNPSTIIAFDMARAGDVTIEVYNIKGQRIKEVVSGSYSAGRHSVVWNGEDSAGRVVGSGIYFYHMTTSGYSSVRKMLLLK